MDEKKLNIRVYNVGVGDCIYIFVPHPDPKKEGKDNACHILIDCGTVSSGKGITSKAIEDLKTLLPKTANGKNRLDILAISHPHEDHYSGFDPSLGGKKGSSNPWYSEFEVGRLWFGSLLDADNQYAKKAREIGELAKKELDRFLTLESGLSTHGMQIGPALTGLVKGLQADGDLRYRITTQLKTQAKKIEYLDSETNEALLSLFPGEQNGAVFRVLSPVREIDKEYLGTSLALMFTQYQTARSGAVKPPEINCEKSTISLSDFNNLYNRMVSSVLTFAMAESHMYNITGLVLLLEWKGYRLLFPGDVEYTSPKSSKERGAWNVLWDRHEKAGKNLLKPVDFLKVGHHGSKNATPWSEEKKYKVINKILDALVQDPNHVGMGEKKRPCTIVVSTERVKKYYHTIPYAPLMEELGRRAKNKVICYDEYDGFYKPRLEEDHKNSKWPADTDYFTCFKENSIGPGIQQPQRTDLHVQEQGVKNIFLDEYEMECACYIDFSFG